MRKCVGSMWMTASLSTLATLAAGVCQAQIVPPVVEKDMRVNIAALHGMRRDQLIVVDMTMKRDGTVGDQEVITGFYDDEYREHALLALKRIHFEPARLNGAPVDFYGWRIVLTTRDNFATSVHPGFEGEYAKVTALTRAGDFAGAEAAIQDLIKSKITTVFEYAFLNEALVPIYVRLNRPYDALRASRSATLRSGHMEAEYFAGTRIQANDTHWPYFLPKANLVQALRQRFTIAAALERFGEAKASYDELRSLDDLKPDDPIVVRAEELDRRARAPEPISIHGKIEHGEWEFSPTRRMISATAIPGTVKSLDVRCRLHTEHLTFEADHDLVLPPPWGNCTLTFAGDNGTDIAVTEKFLPRRGG